jgi:hypothetical protein
MASNSLIELVKQRLASVKTELARATQQRIDAHALENTLIEEMRGYERTLAAELRRNGVAPSESNENSQRPVDSRPEASAATPESNNGHKSAAQSILSYIQAAGSRGMTRGEIKQALKSEGIKVHENYPYVVIAKLKNARKIREDGERLYIQ